MERLRVLDAEFLLGEDDVTHAHIGAVSVFEGPPPAAHDLEQLVAAKLHRIPRYRQRVRSVPLELGRPVWVDDPHFTIAYHLRHTALPRPGGDADLCRLVGRVMSQRLDRNRPLWELWLVEGLPSDRWALISKVHHCMADGISGVDLMAVLLDVARDSPLPEPVPWTPAPAPSGVQLVLDAWSGLAADVADRVGRLPARLANPRDAFRAIEQTGRGLLEMGRRLGPTPPLSIEGTIGPHRRWAHVTVPFDDVRAVRGALGGTVNDVVLTAVAGGLRDLLLGRGEDADAAVIRSLVPVSTRHADAHDAPDNRVSAILCDLPVHLADPVERLHATRSQMADLKATHMAEAGDAVTSAGDLAPPMLVGAVTRLGSRLLRSRPQHAVNTVTTNVPGPQFPLYSLGREMLEFLPFVSMVPGMRVVTAILSYNGRLSFGVTGDFDTVPDIGVVTEGIQRSIAALKTAAESNAASVV